MANYLRNLGMDFAIDDEETGLGLLHYAAANGKAITGYYGLPYINYEFGDAQFILRTEKSEKENALEISGFDTHVPGWTVWDLRCHSMKVDPLSSDPLSKTVVFTEPENWTGLLVTNVVNADVIPSYLENDIVRLQVAFFPDWIKYYKDEDEYDDFFPITPAGKHLGIDNGAVLPLGFMNNHMVTDGESPEDFKEKDYSTDDVLAIHATVKTLHVGKIKIGEQEFDGYIRCTVETQFGDLEIIHNFEQVKEEQRENIRVGANILAAGILQGDVAIEEYDKGIVKTHHNALRLLRSVIEEGDAERLATVLTENAYYKSDYSEATYRGEEEIISRFNEVHDTTRIEYYTHFATITSIDDGEEELPEPVGTRCVVLAANEKYNYESIAFVKCDKNGDIEYIHVCNDSRYHFQIDMPAPKNNPFEGFERPGSYKEAMAVRAGFHCFTDKTSEELEPLGEGADVGSYKSNIEGMLAEWPEGVDRKDEEHIRKMFGYLFAKAIEGSYREKTIEGHSGWEHIVSYDPSDAWNGTITSNFDGVRQERLEFARETGEQFYTDFKNYYQDIDEANQEDFEKDLEEALIFIQHLGAVCAFDYLSVDNEGN